MTVLHSDSPSTNDRRTAGDDVRSRLFPDVQLTPVRIAAIYLVFGFLALYFSDVVLVGTLDEPLLSQVQAVKGGVEVLLTAGFILVVAGRRETQLARTRRDLELQREQLQVLHRVLRHNLRNDVNVVQGYAELIRGRVTREGLEENCAKILHAVDRMARYTDQARRINRITEQNGAIRTEDLSELVPELIDTNPFVTDEISVETSLPETAEVEVNPVFREALNEVLANAVEHNDADDPALSISVEPGGSHREYTTIRVADNGPGIPDSQVRPLEERREEQLLHPDGMGLWLVEWTVQNAGGSVEFSSRNGGTEVVIEVRNANSILPAPLSRDPSD